LSSASEDVAWREIHGAKLTLEALIGEPVRLFAYPNGIPGDDYVAEHVELVARAGFTAAFTTAPGVVTQSLDPFQLPRYSPWNTSAPRFLLNHWRNSRQAPSAVSR
jgi:hypothetical protein